MCGGCFYGYLMATNLLYPMQSPPSCSTHCSVVTVCSSAAKSQIHEHHTAQCCRVLWSFSHFIISLCFQQASISVYLLGKSAVDYIWLCYSLEFHLSIIHARACVASAVTLDLCCISDAYPRGLPMQASTSCQDTGRRTWRLPCWSLLSCLHLSVETWSTEWNVTHKWKGHHFLLFLCNTVSIDQSGVMYNKWRYCVTTGNDSYHNALAVEIVAGDHRFKCM